MSSYVAGLDGGGTKTAVTLMDDNGNIVRTITSGGINYNGMDAETVRGNLGELFAVMAECTGGLEHCAQVVIGAAGVSNPDVIPRLEEDVRACGYPGKLLIVGDQEAALYGAHEGRPGIILVAGTGSICYGRNGAGVSHRSGGFGHLIDDEGSGYSIGRELLSALVRHEDGRIQATAISRLVYEQLELNTVKEVIGFVYDKHRHKKDIAALAPLLTTACDSGDETALGIAARSAQSLYELTVPVTEKLTLQQGRLAMTGSVLLNNSYIRETFVQLLSRHYPHLHCGMPAKDASGGAALMAWTRQGGMTDGV
ncbi:ATPase [Paenibacillus swuensis]|uniref:ATPase n=1 Tax=Paenibacillus swuensis TaxID=1178515 RepID=A0A172TMA8_9BACL|nr:BadF/BadG/BcrA/BcrD ATPase family protein [Paenibacillus swuensis]ANE48209.1 ATPase [Paenibacillus swuensis]